MSQIDSIAGVATNLSNAQFQAQYQVQVLKLQQDTMKALGSAAVGLIDSASATEEAALDLLQAALSTGQNLDVLA